MKYLICGLGNPGRDYENTRHNIGFMVLNQMACEEGISFSDDKYGSLAELKFRGRLLILLKPNTFMNLSGKAIQYWLQKEKISPDNLLVITDDLALPFGTLRLRTKGSDGGHNGLKSIQETLGNSNYSRLRFGIDNQFSKGQQSNYVLSPFNNGELEKIPERVKRSIEIIKSFVIMGPAQTMTAFNNS